MHSSTTLLPLLFLLSTLQPLLAVPLIKKDTTTPLPGLSNAFGQSNSLAASPLDQASNPANSVSAVASTGENIVSSVFGILTPPTKRGVVTGVVSAADRAMVGVVGGVVRPRGVVKNVVDTAGHAVDGTLDNVVKRDEGTEESSESGRVVDTVMEAVDGVVGEVVKRGVAKDVVGTAEHDVGGVVGEVIKRGVVKDVTGIAEHAVGGFMGGVVERGIVENVGNTAGHAVGSIVGEVVKREPVLGPLDGVVSSVVGEVVGAGHGV